MKSLSFKIIVATLILAVTGVIAYAGVGTAPTRVIFKVPFDFQIGNHKYKAGEYRVSRDSQNVVLIEDLDSPASHFLPAGNTNEPLKALNMSNLTFNKYGDRYFLRKINAPGLVVYVGVSRDEKEVRSAGYEKLAKVMVKPEK